jgi:hypothetical protein
MDPNQLQLEIDIPKVPSRPKFCVSDYKVIKDTPEQIHALVTGA